MVMKHIRDLSTRWQIRFKDAGRSPREVSFSFDKASFTRRQIQRQRDELRYLWQRGEWDPWSGRLPGVEEARPVTLLEAVQAYCAHKRDLGRRRQQGGWNAKTLSTYRVELAYFARRTGETRLAARLTERDLERFIHDESIAEATQDKRRRMLKTFVRWMTDQGYVNGLALPRPFVKRRKIPAYVTEGELTRICEAHAALCYERQAEKHVPKSGASAPTARLWMTDAFQVAFYQGLRRGELLALRAGGVDLERKRMVVGDADFIPKGKDERVITVTPPARPLLAQLKGEKAAREHLFPSRHGNQLTAAFKRAARRAVPEKPDLHFHSLRHGCCVFWLEKGVGVKDVRDLLRHKDIKTTMQYSQVVVKGQTDRFEAAYGRV